MENCISAGMPSGGQCFTIRSYGISIYAPANFSNSATNTNGPSEFWSHWFEYDNRGGEGGMMNGWGPFAQNSNGTQSFDNGWSGHE